MSDATSKPEARFERPVRSEWDATGGSMTPFILPGSRLRCERVPISQIREGDVVCYIAEGGASFAHRVTRKVRSGAGFVLFTRGDALFVEEQVPGEAVISVVRRVEHRLFSYDAGGPIGRTIARIALGEDRKTRAAKRLCAAGWRAIAFTRRALKGRFR